MNTNTPEPKVGDAAVIKLAGASISCTVTMTNDKAARFAWKVGPGAFDERWVWIPRAEFADRVTLFPAGTKFMVVEPVQRNKSDESPVYMAGEKITTIS